jgi:hypothetical protein
MCHHLHLHCLRLLHLTLFSKLPITLVFNRRPKDPTDLPSSFPTLANLDEFDVDASNNNIDESHMASDELQVAFETVVLFVPKRSMVFPHVHVVVDEPSTYHEASRIPEWQLAMFEELGALDHQGTGILFHCHCTWYLLHLSGYSKLRPS